MLVSLRIVYMFACMKVLGPTDLCSNTYMSASVPGDNCLYCVVDQTSMENIEAKA